MSKRTIIIGGGISGLALGLELTRQGQEVLLLEAAAHPGGTIGTVRESGWQFETGPNGVLDREGELPRLARELGMEEKLEPAAESAKKRFVFARGKLHSVAASPAILWQGPLGWRARLRLLLEPFSARAAAGSDESIASFGRRHVGPEAVRLLLDPMVTGIYGGDVEQLSLQACFPRMAELEDRSRSLILGALRALWRARREGRKAIGARLTSFSGGMQTLTSAMAERLGERLKLGSQVTRLEQTAHGWRVNVAGNAIEGDNVALCLPAYEQAALIGALDPQATAALAAIPYVPMAVAHIGMRAPPSSLGAFGFLAASSENFPILGAIYASELFPRRAPQGSALYSCMIGGAHQASDVALDDANLVERACQGLAQALGPQGPLQFARICRFPRAIPQYTCGHLARVQSLIEAERRLPGLFFAGNALHGIGVAECLKQAKVLTARLLTP